MIAIHSDYYDKNNKLDSKDISVQTNDDVLNFIEQLLKSGCTYIKASMTVLK